MSNLASLSDDDLDKLVMQKAQAQQKQAAPPVDYSKMSDDDLDKAVIAKASVNVPSEEKSSPGMMDMLQAGLKRTPLGFALNPAVHRGLKAVGDTVSTGVAGLAGLVTGNGPSPKDYDNAYVGKGLSGGELLEKAGVPKGPNIDLPLNSGNLSARDVGGFLAKAATDPTLYGLSRVGAGPANQALEAGGKSFAGSGVNDIAQTLAKPGAEQIRAAARQMGVKPTQGMLTGDYIVRNTEDSLGQSPTIAGDWIRKEQEPVRKAIQGAAEGAVKDQSHLSNYEAGKAQQKGVVDYFEGKREPINQSYREIESHTKNIPLNDKGLKRISNNIRGLDEARFEGSEGNTIANQFANWLEQAKDVNDIKLLKTKAGHILRDPNASFEAKSVASSITGKLEQAQTNSITRQAVQISRENPIDRTSGGKFLNKAQSAVADEEATAEGQDIGRKLIGDIKSTNKDYRGLLEETKTFGKGSGLTKANKGLSATISDIENAKPEDVSKALFDSGDVNFLKFMKEKMPEQAEIARQQKLAQFVKQTGGDTNKIIKLADKMGPEARAFLFGDENVKNLGNANTLLQSIPGKVGASDTPRGFQFKDLLSPSAWAQNVEDVGRYGLIKGKKNFPKAGLMMQKSSPYVQGLVNEGLLQRSGNER